MLPRLHVHSVAAICQSKQKVRPVDVIKEQAVWKLKDCSSDITILNFSKMEMEFIYIKFRYKTNEINTK